LPASTLDLEGRDEVEIQRAGDRCDDAGRRATHNALLAHAFQEMA
jgi:hypothetical protein